MNIVVFGAGSLGSLIGGLLAREHAVTLVGRDPHVAAVRDSGLRVGGQFDFAVGPAATTDGTDLAADLAVVTVKAFDTGSAAEALATGEFDAALSLQNGMGNEETLSRVLDCTVLAGTATYGAVLQAPGVVECTGRGEVVLGPRDGVSAETAAESATESTAETDAGSAAETAADRVGEAFSTAGIETTVTNDMPRRLWEKLAVNAAINATTALARVENGAVRDGHAREVAADAARETARVARAEGIELSDAEAVRAVERVAEATAANTSSMHQDVLAGRRTEVAAINGSVCERAREAEPPLSAPVNRTLTNLLRAWEEGRADDGSDDSSGDRSASE
jgi:2-dehydropantoate 2-reductase